MNNEKKIFIILLLIINIITNFFILKTENIIEKLFLIIFSICQIISIIFIIKNYYRSLLYIGKINILFIIFVLIFNQNYKINIFFILIILLILFTRFIFNKCLFDVKKNSKIFLADILYYLLLILFFIKIF